jgi:hypothetical protein
VAQNLNTNIKPYYDDFDPVKNYYQVLYKAGYPIQARELNAAQSITQDQLSQLGQKFLAPGDVVTPGEFSFANPVNYVKISQITPLIDATDYIGLDVTGVTSKVKATIIHAEPATAEDSITFFVKYQSSGNNQEDVSFAEGEKIKADSPSTLTAIIGNNSNTKPTDSPALGRGCLFTTKSGSYFVDGYVVRNYAETIAVSKYTTDPSYQIGFIVTQAFVTCEEDLSLLDNSQGSTNFAAPGADRLKIDLNLIKLDIDATVPNFVRLATIVNGNLQGSPNQTIKWDWLYQILARRTYDESGDYIVKDFTVQPMEYVNTNELDGLFNPTVEIMQGKKYNMYPPVPGSGSTDKLSEETASSKYVLNVSSGLAYVHGYEAGYDSSTYQYGDKARDVKFTSGSGVSVGEGPYFEVAHLYGTPDIENSVGDNAATALSDIIIYRNFIDGYAGDSVDVINPGAVDQYIRPKNTGNAPLETYHVICDKDITSIAVAGMSVIWPTTGNIGRSVVITSATNIRRGDLIGSSNATVTSVIKVSPAPMGVLRPKYLVPSNMIASSSAEGEETSFYDYESSYKLGVLGVNYFTSLIVNECSDGWRVGEKVIGESSGAIGVLEQGSQLSGSRDLRSFVLSNVMGEFQEGEDITPEGLITRSATIYKDGEVGALRFIGPGDLTNVNVINISTLGQKFKLEKAKNHFTGNSTELVLTKTGRDALYNWIVALGIYARRLNYEVTTDNDIKGFAFLPNPVIKNAAENVKSFYSTLEDVNDFSADISSIVSNTLDRTVVGQSCLFAAAKDTNILFCNNYSGDPSLELQYGDIIAVTDDSGKSATKMVLFATQPSGYGQNRSPAAIYVSTTFNTAIKGSQVERVRCKKGGSTIDNSIYQLSQNTIKTLESTPNATGINYSMYRIFYAEYNGSTRTITITSGKSNHTFYGVSRGEVLISVAEDLTNKGALYDGRTIAPVRVSVLESGTKLEITVGVSTNVQGNRLKLKVIAPVTVTNAKAKKKILKSYTVRISSGYADNKVLSLGRTDVLSIQSVKIFDISVTPPIEINDITSNYVLDDGQRDNYYDISRLIVKGGYPVASSTLPPNNWEVRVEYKAFTHTTDGDFFSVDSYTHSQGIEYSRIPIYYPSAGIADSQRTDSPSYLQLRDCVDFRPSVNTAGANASKIALIEPGIDEQNAINFRDSTKGGNSDVSRSLEIGSTFVCNVESYLPRIDSLFLDSNGGFKLKKGVANANPKPPENDSTSLRLYDMILPPYTFTAEDIYLRKYNYRRYTMGDISTLDKRLTKVEDYVTLSLLEQSALNTNVRDGVTGLDRFKNGFVVDPFMNHSNGQTSSYEYRCSIDPKLDQLRAPHYTQQIELEEVFQSDAERNANMYAKSGPIVTLPYKNVMFVENKFATKTVNLQPFNVFVYDGSIKLNPEIDTWKEIRQRPKLVVEDNSLYQAAQDMVDEMVKMGMGTVWSDWETTSTQLLPGTTTTYAEAVRLGYNIIDGGGSLALSNRPVSTDSLTVANQLSTQFRLNVNPNTSTTVQTSQGNRVVDMQIARSMRSRPVFFTAHRLKPNTRYYAFFDDIDVNDWVSPDNPSEIKEGSATRYLFKDPANTNRKGFGAAIVSDDVGTITGVFWIPNGYPPIAGTQYTGDSAALAFDTNKRSRSFDTGTKIFRLTTNKDNGEDVKGFAESDYTSSGIILDKQETIVSTRTPSIEWSATGNTRTRTVNVGTANAVAYDPVAQTFLVDANNPDGVFVTELDVYFATKDKNESVCAYLVTTSGEVPTQNVLPFSFVTKNSDSNLRVKCTLKDNKSDKLLAGTVVVGTESKATGVVKAQVDFDNTTNKSRNVTDTVYDVILENFVGEFKPGEQITPKISPTSTSVFTIVNDEVLANRIDIKAAGTTVSSTKIAFSSPDLPGGDPPVATAVVDNGKLIRVDLVSPGSGYISAPTATIAGGAKLEVRVIPGRKAVDMGVSTSEDASAATTFKFDAPVYLMGNTTYAFVLKSPNSLEYEAYISKLGENIIGTKTRVVQQPLLGSIFRSQNGGLWTEDQTEDIMFTLKRADFVTGSVSNVALQNAPLGFQKADIDPFETSEGSSNIKVYLASHGSIQGDYVVIRDVSADVNGIPFRFINGIHQVTSSDFNHLYINVNRKATSSGKGGGSGVYCSVGLPFEVFTLYTGSLLFKNTTSEIGLRSAGCAGISGTGVDPYVIQASETAISNEISHYYLNPKQCASYINEAIMNGANQLQGRRSINLGIYLSTSDSKISPVYDLERTNAVLSRSLINYPKVGDTFYGAPTRVITFSNSDIQLKSEKIATFMENKEERKLDVMEWHPSVSKLKVRGFNVLDFSNEHQLLVRNMPMNDENTNPVISVSNAIQPYFVDETQQGGSAFAKWISREFKLENPSDGISIKMGAVTYDRTSIRLYYILRPEGFDGSLFEKNWVPFNSTGVCDNNKEVAIRTNDTIDPRMLNGNDWIEYTWTAQDLQKFTAFSVKIVMISSNPCKCPLIDDIRIIASE